MLKKVELQGDGEAGTGSSKDLRSSALTCLVGQRFGRLLVISQVKSKSQSRHWACVCDCGTEVVVPTYRLSSGNTKSCGCLKRDKRAELNKTSKTKHGLSKSREYEAWCNMMQRCIHKPDKNYGLRGITVAPEFQEFPAFFSYLGPCPDGLTLERIDVNKGYERGNIKWATAEDQARNKRASVKFSLGGEIVNAVDLADRLGVSPSTITSRVKAGRSLEEIVSLEKGVKRVFYLGGAPVSLATASKLSGIPYHTLWARVNRQGLSLDEAVAYIGGVTCYLKN